ncbi:hypothetical protein F5882DRAFT_482080 [Hyaloscypha sp. PMI_1271]|nr:hypothetical protein F5882DRAFT_482080 [Hyaloscypha sp. PMI_1271]
MLGWKKIEGCCQMASRDQLEWAWVDSCCIDKTSSAELSEAINSMFRWYRDAEVCYAYLSDVWGPLEPGLMMMGDFRSSKWFTRGWTLQELLAPDELKFFNKDWGEIGTKESLREALCQVTGIKHLFNFEDASVAQKMSWAAKRVTTRLEDQAYCLLGIFGVNMPPLYGEGPGAFLRLQLEIMRISNDESLFAWEDDSIESGGLLAPSPKSFRYSTDIISADPPLIERPPYLMTNRGLEIFLYFRELHLEDGYAVRVKPGENRRLAPLNCAREGKELDPLGVAISLGSNAKGNFQRTGCNFIVHDRRWQEGRLVPTAQSPYRFEKVWINQPQMNSGTHSYCCFRIRTLDLNAFGWKMTMRYLLNSELGRWGADADGCVNLKLSNSTGSIMLQGAETCWTGIPMLKVSCTGKNGYVALVLVNTLRPHYFRSDVFGSMRNPTIDKLISNEPTVLTKSVGKGKSLQASVWKEGGSGSRVIFNVKLEVVDELPEDFRI